jgi:hypothetical protein
MRMIRHLLSWLRRRPLPRAPHRLGWSMGLRCRKGHAQCWLLESANHIILIGLGPVDTESPWYRSRN